jgi:hypothetical protein
MRELTLLRHDVCVVGGGVCQPVIWLQGRQSNFGSCVIDESQQNGDAAGFALLNYHWTEHVRGGLERSACRCSIRPRG